MMLIQRYQEANFKCPGDRRAGYISQTL